MDAAKDEPGLPYDHGAAAPADAASTDLRPAAAPPPRILGGKQRADLDELRREPDFASWTIAFRWSALGSEEWAAFPHDGEGYLTARTAVGLAAKLRAAS